MYNGKYKDIKEEILNSGHVTKKNFDDQILTKSKEYQGTQRGKQAIYKYKGFEGILEMRKEKGVDHPFSYGDIMSVNHLIAIICYTDYTDLCTAWTATFRPSFIGESQSSIQERQRSYYHLSKNLYQIVNYFGVYCHGQEDKQTRQMNESEGFYVSWCDDSGPFYCGMSRTMPFPSFNIDLNSPTSTSQAIEVATRFSGSNGVIITFNNNGLHDNDRTAFFDARWISHFPEEQE